MHKKTLGLVLFMFALMPQGWASVAGEVNKANGLYAQGKFDDSLDLYSRSPGS